MISENRHGKVCPRKLGADLFFYGFLVGSLLFMFLYGIGVL